MRDQATLRSSLRRIDGAGYKAYLDIRGSYELGDFTLCIDHVQGDPFAHPSRFRVRVPREKNRFPENLFDTPVRKMAFEDFLARQFRRAIGTVVKGRRGTGKSGVVEIDSGRQEVLERNSMCINREWVEARFWVGLPAAGRRILGREAEEIILNEIPIVVGRSLSWDAVNHDSAKEHIDAVEDQEAIRGLLREKELVAFISDGSILPRRSGVDDRPMPTGDAVSFLGPSSLSVTLSAPNRGEITGMGIPEGVTLIVGGGFHGKSTVLKALEKGVYPHIPGDGRELVVSDPATVKIRSEDGRGISGVNISPFIQNLPFQRDTMVFSTENASGSTSQAANIIEAVEVGARVLLIDEDTSATNFMIRDQRMQELVVKEKEPITPFVDRVRQLYREFGISTILVMGGSGDYFEVADTVIMMDAYEPRDATVRVHHIRERCRTERHPEGGDRFGSVTDRIPKKESFDPSRGSRDVKIETKGFKQIVFGTTQVDLSAIEQLVDASQTRAIGELIYYYGEKYAALGYSLKNGLEKIMSEIDTRGLDILSPRQFRDLARPRVFEVAAAINRMRSLKVT